MSVLPLLVHLSLAAPMASYPISPDQSVHLGISLNLTHLDELAKLRAAQLDPRSPQFRQWLTPQQFGERFGQSAETYSAFSAWLRAAGLSVTEAPNRAFIEAVGTAAQVEQLLAIHFEPVEGAPAGVHNFTGKPRFPAPFAAAVLYVAGLDTRVLYHHNILAGSNQFLGPQDLRRFYNLMPLLDAGWVAQQQKTVVVSTATSADNALNTDAVGYFLRNVSDVSTPFIQDALPNPGNDIDPQFGAGIEFDLDVEMQSVGNVGGSSIVQIISPASEVFTTGLNGVVNRHADATAVSLSLGICEPGEKQQHPNEPAAARNAIIQGTVEGQTWFAASGDNGANDCGQMVNVLAADFPSDIPEMMAIGGSELPSPAWNANHAITAYAQEVVWNDGTMGGAAGGGLSVLFPMPSYQLGLVPDGGRSIPDIAMMAGNPGVAIMVLSPPGEFFNQPTVGTSVASPLSAGMFALMASRIGCRLGDVHETLYALGRAQDAGTVVFHDIVTGNLNFGSVNGPAAAPGFDSASGWGSLDVAALAAAWPACPPLPDGGTPAPIDAGAPYTPCNAICDGGTMCQTLPDGPSTCALACDADGGCPGASVCNTKTIFTMNGPGQCVPGCQSDSDCAVDAGLVCAACGSSCIPKGSPGAHIGDGCTSNAQCPTGATCQDPTYLGFEFLPGGYCTEACDPAAMSGSCMCPAGSTCMTAGAAGQSFSFCFKACSSTADCGRTGYVCQKLTTGDSVCTPKCQNVGGFFDTCQAFPVTGACNQTSGLCGDKPDAGHTDAGQPDAGHVDAGPTDDTVTLPAAGGKIGPARAGCGCGEAAAAPLLLAMLGLLLRRRR